MVKSVFIGRAGWGVGQGRTSMYMSCSMRCEKGEQVGAQYISPSCLQVKPESDMTAGTDIIIAVITHNPALSWCVPIVAWPQLGRCVLLIRHCVTHDHTHLFTSLARVMWSVFVHRRFDFSAPWTRVSIEVIQYYMYDFDARSSYVNSTIRCCWHVLVHRWSYNDMFYYSSIVLQGRIFTYAWLAWAIIANQHTTSEYWGHR